MRLAIALSLLLCVVGCDREGPDSKHAGGSGGAQRENSNSEPKLHSNEVRIDQNAQQKAGIVTEQVSVTESPEYLTTSGQIVTNEEQTAHIGSYTDGRVMKVMANVGDQVRRGQVLARMHSHDVHETQAAYRTAKEAVARQQNTVTYQQRLRDRMTRLYELKSSSKLEVDKAGSDLRAAENDLASAQIAVQKEVAHLTDILHLPDSAIDNVSEEAEQIPVISPITGIVVERKINTGSVVEPGDEVFVISDLSSVWLIAAVNESDISKMRVGLKAELLSNAFPDQMFAGRITRISTELDPRSRTLPVRILVPNPSRKLKTAMYVSARIAQGSSRGTIFLREDAVQDINGSAVVFVHNQNDVFEARPVEIAHKSSGRAEISSGLRPGELVVVKGSFIVKSEMLKSQIGE